MFEKLKYGDCVVIFRLRLSWLSFIVIVKFIMVINRVVIFIYRGIVI